MVGMKAERVSLDIKSYSNAFLEGKLDKLEIAELRDAMNAENWRDLTRQRYVRVQLEKLNSIKTKTREQLDLSDVVALLVMLVEK